MLLLSDWFSLTTDTAAANAAADADAANADANATANITTNGTIIITTLTRTIFCKTKSSCWRGRALVHHVEPLLRKAFAVVAGGVFQKVLDSIIIASPRSLSPKYLVWGAAATVPFASQQSALRWDQTPANKTGRTPTPVEFRFIAEPKEAATSIGSRISTGHTPPWSCIATRRTMRACHCKVSRSNICRPNPWSSIGMTKSPTTGRRSAAPSSLLSAVLLACYVPRWAWCTVCVATWTIVWTTWRCIDRETVERAAAL